VSIDPDEVFAAVDADRESGELSHKVTTARFRYYAAKREGYIERIDSETGDRIIGTFKDGAFTPLRDE
jgi:hypothetical protein